MSADAGARHRRSDRRATTAPPVLRDLDLHVGAGEVVALLGPNGAGKTTTLRAISGLVRPIAGAIRLDGEDLARRSPTARARLGIAHVPEGTRRLLRAHRRRALPARPSGRAARRRRRLRVLPAARRRSPIAGPGCCPGGEQQMLALGRALARRPRLMLLDEPSLGLAPVIVEDLLPDRVELRQGERLRGAARRAAHPHRAGGGRPRLRALARRARHPRARRRRCAPTTS